MATYREQVEYAESLRLVEGGSYRGDCPFCSGRNTYGANLRMGELVWGCFRASCDVGGYKHGEISRAGILSRMSQESPSVAVSEAPRGIPVPVLTSIETHPSILTFLKNNNSLKSYELGLIDIKYSPQEDRVMFPTWDKSGWIGRGRQGIFPKWKKFGDCSQLLTCGNGKIGVVVEDALSACAVGVIPGYTGCSLSGTILHQNQISKLREYDSILVCLDPDALSKGLQMVGRLGSRASMRIIPDDLKRFNPEQIERILNG